MPNPSSARGKTWISVAVGVAGLMIGAAVYTAPTIHGFVSARQSGTTLCSWGGIADLAVAPLYKQYLESAAYRRNSIVRSEPGGFTLVKTPTRDFWVTLEGSDTDGKSILAHLLAEHEWMESANPSAQVKPGDVVVDCGAHVGTFTHYALSKGAAKVVAIEPFENSVQCLRRTFAREIADGRVVIVQKAVWSEDGPMEFTVSDGSPGMNSAVMNDGTRKITISGTRIDTLVDELQLGKVGYIKMDIEGAEREALTGASRTLANFKPRLMIENYHLPDDSTVLPKVILSAQPAYSMTTGPCGAKFGTFIPYVLYFE